MKMIAGAIILLAGVIAVVGSELSHGGQDLHGRRYDMYVFGMLGSLAGAILTLWGFVDDLVDRSRGRSQKPPSDQ